MPEFLLILCLAQPCVMHGSVLQVPVPEVSPYFWAEQMPSYRHGALRVVFVPVAEEV
jgi:hypothetical protein